MEMISMSYTGDWRPAVNFEPKPKLAQSGYISLPYADINKNMLLTPYVIKKEKIQEVVHCCPKIFCCSIRQQYSIA